MLNRITAVIAGVILCGCAVAAQSQRERSGNDDCVYLQSGPAGSTHKVGNLVPAGRQYFRVAIAKFAQNYHTHVEATGRVALVKHEKDGDTHIRLEDNSGHFLVAECIPVLPCIAPKVGQTVTVRGISRFDGEHKWWEVHPVENLKVLDLSGYEIMK